MLGTSSAALLGHRNTLGLKPSPALGPPGGGRLGREVYAFFCVALPEVYSRTMVDMMALMCCRGSVQCSRRLHVYMAKPDPEHLRGELLSVYEQSQPCFSQPWPVFCLQLP